MGSSEGKDVDENQCDFVVLVLLGGRKKSVQKHLGSKLAINRFREASLESQKKSSSTLDVWSLIMRQTDQKEKQKSLEEKWGELVGCTCQCCCVPESPSHCDH